jgi:hypothetical protein
MAGQASHAVFGFGSRFRAAIRVFAALWRHRALKTDFDIAAVMPGSFVALELPSVW